MKKRLLIIILTILFLVSFSACQDTTTNLPTTTGPYIEVDTQYYVMPIGGSLAIGYEANVEDIIFESTDPDVASVRIDGLVSALEAGETTILLKYLGTTYATLTVVVTGEVQLIIPEKTVYRQGEELDLSGSMLILNWSDADPTEIQITQDMVSGYASGSTGFQQVQIEYLDVEYSFEVLVLSDKQEACIFDHLVVRTNDPIQYDKVELALMKTDLDGFLEAIDNVYDYNEISINATIETPDHQTDHIKAFWMQPYGESLVFGGLDQSRNLEGTVTLLPEDYDLVLNYLESGDPGYYFRYLPETAGTYEVSVEVMVDDAVIQTLETDFVVADSDDSERQGYILVDQTNNRHFQFSSGESYVPVGQNVAWYTSLDRKYYDYDIWFGKMHDSGMDYARIWMAAWGFSLFWDDVENYDQRQTNLKSLDAVVELAEEYGIYLQVCILHHGMFSRYVNPMWPGSSNTWYINKYGANPYGDYLDYPGEYFTDTWAKNSLKNQLDYIVARYGYSDNIMSWELFNEVDWIEEYTASDGLAWHGEMASYLKIIDPNHLVTTSFKSESFYSSTYNVFKIDAIDYVNVHRYGIYNHLDHLPTYQESAGEIFDKPILYSEIGYSGNGGADQMEVDPDNVTLHQALWGGMMGSGAGSGMNWWWDSWIHPGNAYDVYRGAGIYAKLMDLSGTSYRTLDEAGVTLSDPGIGALGYLVDDRLYAYVYDESYTLDNADGETIQGITMTIPQVDCGTYNLVFYDTKTGVELSSTTIEQEVAGSLILTISDFNNDVALILKP